MTNPIEELRKLSDNNWFQALDKQIVSAILYLADIVMSDQKGQPEKETTDGQEIYWGLEKRKEGAEWLKNNWQSGSPTFLINQAFGLEPQKEPPKDELVEALERITTDFVLTAIPDKTPLGITDFYNCKIGIAQAIATELRKDPNRWFEAHFIPAEGIGLSGDFKVRAK